ncbi:MAG: phosphatidate cytidylyltransferase [Oscillibacter ruminantium]|jgi:phosphatidate cytidylyltransferase|uniref:phosphatidate cytidylyltransferase n=1 Tax=Oscillibacter ruminantium TaxID=1263547 RepID=UPI002B1F3145|nr:phosphatidate cytidylyltransferase [Oscillibacter ruminantium]MEA5041607.1 phosphatidate cytidylyltransferase [Oscillibacter ruminantium]
MFKRVMVAVVGIPALILILGFAPEMATMLLAMALCGVGAWELMRAVAGEGGEKLARLTVLVAAVFPAVMYEELVVDRTQRIYLAVLADLPLTAALALALVLLVFLSAVLDYTDDKRITFSDVTAALFAGGIFPLMMSCLLLLRLEDYGQLLVFVPLGIAFGSDTFALFGGLLCGKHKLTPVSPKKTVEGAVGGLLGGVIGLALIKLVGLWLLGLSFLTWGQVILLGLAGSAVSQIGDLSFSVIKREFGVKDYGNLLPGHGGVLDRFDSVTFVAPFVWLALRIL